MYVFAIAFTTLGNYTIIHVQIYFNMTAVKYREGVWVFWNQV